MSEWNLQGDEDAVELGDVVVELLFILDCLLVLPLLTLLFELLVASEDEMDENEVSEEVISTLFWFWLLFPVFRLLLMRVTAVMVLLIEFPISDLSGLWLMFM